MRSLLGIIIGSLFVLSANITLAEDALLSPRVSYKEYLAEVLAYYPLLKKEHASVEKAIAQKALVASGRVPEFWASVKAEYGDDPVYVFGALLRQNRFTSDDFSLGRLNTPSPRVDYSAGVGGQWLLFDFSQTTSRIKAAGLLAESAQFQSESTRMEAILAASEVYSRLAITSKLLETLDEVVSKAEDDVAMAESLSHKGLVLGADFYLARMTKTQLLQTVNETQAQRAALAMVFNVLRGTDPTLPVEVEMDFKKPLSVQGTAQEWIAKAVVGRLDIKTMEKSLEAQGFEVTSEKGSFLPKVMAYGNADENVHRIGDSGGENYIVGIKAKMDLFDPGYGSRVKAAKEEVKRLVAGLQEAKDQAVKDTAEIYYRLQALETNAQLAVQNRDDAAQAAKLMAPLYQQGRRSIDQMISVRAGLVQSQEYWLKLEAARRQNVLILKYYAGELTPGEAESVYGQ
ncbi:MAG: TolC family protein [Candidatus Omnitrophica bacterium]|nr:TolC family protein [Candidatus Omnitrophota bacterium]